MKVSRKLLFLSTTVFFLGFNSQTAFSNEPPASSESFFSKLLSILGIEDDDQQKTQPNETNTSKSNQYYDDALAQLKANKADAAVIQLRNAIKYDNKNLSAYILLGQTYLNINNGFMAESTYKEAILNGIEQKYIAKHLAEAYLQQYKFKQIIEDIEINGLPKSLKTDIYLARSKAYLGMGNLNEAKKALDVILQTESNYTPGILQTAKIKLSENQLSESQELLDSIAETGAYDPEYWLLRGEIARKQAKNTEAINYFSKALKINQKHLVSLQARASLYIDNDQLELGQEDVSNIRKNFPEDLRGLMLQALLNIKTGNTDGQKITLSEAYKSIEKINFLKLQDDPYNLMLISNLYFLGKRYAEAENLLNRYLELQANDFKAYHLLATIQLNQNKASSAKSTLKNGLEKGKNLPLLILLAETEMRLQNFKEAIFLFNMIAKESPASENIQQGLALAKLADGKIPEAIQILKKQIKDNNFAIANQLTLAKIYLSLGEYENALKICREVTLKEPNLPMPYNIEGNAYLGLNNTIEAKSAFQKSLSKAPEFIPSIFNLAVIDIQEDQFEEATNKLKRILEIDEQNILAMKQIADIFKRKNDLKQEIIWLQKAFDIKPEVDPGIRLIKLYYQNSQSFEVESTLKTLLQLQPENLKLLEESANLSIAKDNTEKAKNIYKQMSRIATNNQNIQELLYISKLQQNSGDLKNASDSINKALELSPNNIAALSLQAEISLSKNEYDQALETALYIIKLSPNHPSGYHLAGNIYSILDNPDEAIQWLKEGITRAPNNEALALSYFKALQQNNNVEKSVQFLESWASSNKNLSTSTLQALAAGYGRTGNYDQAISINEKLLKIEPRNPYLMNNLALLYLEVNNPKALELAEQAFNLVPDSYAILDTLGWILTQKGDLERALPLLRNAAARSFNSPDIQYHFAKALFLSGENQQAASLLRQILLRGQTFNESTDAKKLLNEIENL